MASRSECVEILCTIFQLPSDGSAELSIISYLDERYFSVRRITIFVIVLTI